jgi:hypothetical protein
MTIEKQRRTVHTTHPSITHRESDLFLFLPDSSSWRSTRIKTIQQQLLLVLHLHWIIFILVNGLVFLDERTLF